MDGCLQPWLIGCVIDWEAWAAVGTMLAVFYAIYSTIVSESRRRKNEAALNRTIIYQLHFELRRIFQIASWWQDLDGSVKRGEIPSDFAPAIRIALQDARTIETPIYNAFSHLVPSVDTWTANFLIPAFAKISIAAAAIKREADKSGLAPTQAVFDELAKSILPLHSGLYLALAHTSKAVNFNPKEQQDAGQSRYLVPEFWEDD